MRDALIEESTAFLKSADIESVQKLYCLVQSASSENIQRAAANDLLGHLAKHRELEDLETLLTELEQIAAKIKVR